MTDTEQTEQRTPEQYVGSRWLRRTGRSASNRLLPELRVIGLSLSLTDDQGRPLLEVKTRGGKRGVRAIGYLLVNYREVARRG